MEAKFLTVSEINQYVRSYIEANDFLAGVGVKGEISSFKRHSSGHMYFTLKDQKAGLRCVMFKNQNQKLKFIPETGMKVFVLGSIRVFVRDGVYQLYVDAMEPAGIGSLHLAFSQLKSKLEEEGLFRIEDKLSLPLIPRKVGIITSPTGAAIFDIINVARRRFPNIDLLIAPVLVQGHKAAAQLLNAIKILGAVPRVDVIIIGRGGGAWEELQAFNDEALARGIRACPIPVVTAIGHETDFTIADFAADLRAPTPSAAAELVVPDIREMGRRLDNLQAGFRTGILQLLESKRLALENIQSRRVLAQPRLFLNEKQQLLDFVIKDLELALNKRLTDWRHHLSLLSGQLDSLSPLAVLKRGYSLVYDENRRIVRTPAGLSEGSKVKIVLAKGQIRCVVEELKGGEEIGEL
jgi:exodeoxyribonuclease VII large subunit